MQYYFLFFFFLLLNGEIRAQTIPSTLDGTNGNTIPTAVPFLLIAPDAKSSSLGDAGASTDPDVFSSHWNPAKLSQIEGDYGLGVGYVPWLKNIDANIYLASFSGFKKVGSRVSIGFGIEYFNLGQTLFKDESGYQNGAGYPNEFSLEATYSQKVGRYFSLGLNGKYIHSDLTNGQIYQGAEVKPGNTAAFDIAFYYRQNFEKSNPNHLAIGFAISNIGPKISYGSPNKSFLPTNLKIGISYGQIFNDIHYTNFSLEFNKLLVPTIPITDSKGNIILGRETNRSVLSGIFGSFTDAPGGFNEVLQEFSISPGFEYRYDNTLCLRTGLYLENKNFGNRKYINFGMGLKIKSYLDLSVSYLETLVPVSTITNTFRISLAAIL